VKVLNSKILLKASLWGTSSFTNIISVAVIISFLLTAISIFFSPIVLCLSVILVLLILGTGTHVIMQSDAPIPLKHIDRFFQQVPCYLSIQDRDMNIIRTNEFFRRDFGERINEKCYRVYKNIEEICPNCPVLKTFSDGKTHSTEEKVITKDGKTAHMIVYTTPVINEHGKIIGAMEMSTNITEIKKLQKEIQTSQREFRDLFERVPCYISILDRDFRIIRVNKMFEREFGAHFGKHCYEVFKHRDTICPDCHVAKTFKDGNIYSSEKNVITKEGDIKQVIVYSSPIYDDKQEIVAVMEMSTDISEVKRLQQELTYMGKTIALMAHRIKNLLMGLEGGIFVVNTGMEDDDDTMIKQGWGMIERNVEMVSQIVKDLLFCSKDRQMDFQQIKPSETVLGVYELFKGRAQKEGIEFKLNMPEPLPEGLFDPDALHSLLTNLVTNAFEACVNDTSEIKKIHRIIIHSKKSDNDKLVFEVEDNGPGIPSQVREAVFEDFFSTKGREGTGLGLLVAQKIVEEHNGTLTFTSTEGKRTVFRVVLPYKTN